MSITIDKKATINFIFNSKIPARDKRFIYLKHKEITRNIDCPHKQSEIYRFVNEAYNLPKSMKGCFVEAGCYKGGSTAKFSIIAEKLNRKLIVFDSFNGLPEHSEDHGINIFKKPVSFAIGEYKGEYDEVLDNVRKYGHLISCSFIKGWFKNTMPHFKEDIAMAYIDVDLVTSVSTCFKYIYPLLVPGGVIYCHDGHLPLIIELLSNDQFWEKELGCKKPEIEGLGEIKLIKLIKK